MRKCILLVEDSAVMRRTVAAILERVCDVMVYAVDGPEALLIAEAERPETIVLDVSLPGISGLDLLPQLRRLVPNSRIVVLTNHTSEVYRIEAFLRGADAYVLKGAAGTDLLPAVQLRAPTTGMATL